MQEQSFAKKLADGPLLRAFPRLAGIFVALFGLLIVISWPMHWRNVIQVLPGTAPIKFNTALCFMLCGSALFCLTASRPKLTAWLGGIVVVFSFLTLLEYAMGLDFGIDTAFFKPYFETATAYPGRMSPLAAFCFIFIGTSLFLGGAKVRGFHRLTGTAMLACITGVIAIVAVLGYAFGIEAAYDWGAYTHMAANTAVAFVLLSSAILVWAGQKNRDQNFNFSSWLPVTASVTLMIMVGFVSTGTVMEMRHATYWRKHTVEVLLDTQVFEDNIVELQRGLRGYMTQTDTNGLATFETCARLEARQFNQLLAMTRDNHVQQQRLKKLSAAMNDLFAYDRRTIALCRQKGFTAALKTDTNDVGRAVFGNAREILQAFTQEEERLLRGRDASEQEGSNDAERVLMFGSGLAAVLLVIASIMAGRELRRRKQIELKLRELTAWQNMIIVEREKAEAAMRESEERFRRAFNDAPIGMSLVSPVGRWLRVNRALSEMLGYTETELLATDFQHITHADDLTQDLGLVMQMLAGEIPSYRMEKRYFHKNGSLVNAMLHVSLVRDYQGKPLYFVSQIENITERKLHESEREKMIIELRTALAQVKTLSGYIPICAWCKNVRSDQGYWQSVEQFVRSRTDATFSHGMCPTCTEKFTDDMLKEAPGSAPS